MVKDDFTLLACQIDVPVMSTSTARDLHVERAASSLDKELGNNGKVDLAVLPELSTLEYSRSCFEQIANLAEDLDTSPSLKAFGLVARKHQTPLLVGMARRGDGGAYYISQVLIDGAGTPQAYYDKLHIAQFGESIEKEFFTRGDHIMVFDIGGFRFGTIICYDIRSPELSRHLARHHHVDVILHPTAFYRDETFHTWLPFATTRAVENQVYFASFNRAGDHFGHSVLVEPWVDETTPLNMLGVREEFSRWSLKRNVIKRARVTYPFMDDALDDYIGL